ncbi:retrovirus-related pol polyprotein from transposon TNT 1-94 [Tanacetum coccineum]
MFGRDDFLLFVDVDYYDRIEDDADADAEPEHVGLCVYEPCSGHINSIGIGGESEICGLSKSQARQGDLYVLDHFRDIHGTASSSVDLSSFWLNRFSSAFYLWHSWLGHVSGSRLRFLASTGALGKLDAHDISNCSGCKLAKFLALPFSNSISSSTAPFDIVHSDVWGPSSVSTKGGSKYYVSFIDGFTRYTCIYLMKRRFDFLTVFKEFKAFVKTQHRAVIKCFRCDLGGEYTSNEFVGLLRSDGTIYQTSCTDTPQQDGHKMGEAFLTATYVINRIPTAHNSGLSPFEKLYGTLPDYSSLRVFGSYVERTKLSAKSTLWVFLGYGVSQKGYRCYDPVKPTPIVSPITPEPALETPSETTTTTETPPLIISEATPTVTQLPPMTTQSSSEVAAVPPANIPPTRIQKSTRKDDFVYSCYSSSFSSFIASVHRLHEPESYREAVCDPLWHVAMAEELAALHQTQTWDLVPLPIGKRAIGSCWVYKIKTKSTGSIKRYKARLVAKGEVCKLRKALYGLKQAPRAWYEKFATVVTSLGFVSSHHDSALFVKQSSAGRILLSLYVDDMIITRDDYAGIESLKLELAHRFAMKDLGLLCYFLGIEVASSLKGYLLSQSKYIGDLLDRARITYKMVEDISIDAKAKYTPPNGDPLPDPSLYRTIVGSLVYLTVTRPDISYVVHIVSQFVLAPTTVHWVAVLHILKYLRGTQLKTLLFPSTSSLDLRAYFDSDWAGDVIHASQLLDFVYFWIADAFTKPHSGPRFRFLTDKLSMFLAAAL